MCTLVIATRGGGRAKEGQGTTQEERGKKREEE